MDRIGKDNSNGNDCRITGMNERIQSATSPGGSPGIDTVATIAGAVDQLDCRIILEIIGNV